MIRDVIQSYWVHLLTTVRAIAGLTVQMWIALDSSTSLRFITSLRNYTDQLQSTVVMSIYQAYEAMHEVRH